MNFTTKQREIVARKLGYDGPMQGFDEFLQSSPALMMKYNSVTDKYAKRMAQGGAVVKMADGGTTGTYEWVYNELNSRYGERGVLKNNVTGDIKYTAWRPTGDKQGVYDLIQPMLQEFNPAPPPPPPPPPPPAPAPTPAPAPAPPAPPPPPLPGGTTFTDVGGKPVAGEAASMTAEQIKEQPDQIISGVESAPKTATQATVTKAADATQATEPTKTTAGSVTASTAAGSVRGVLEGQKPLSFEDWRKDKLYTSDMAGNIKAREDYDAYAKSVSTGLQPAKGTVSKEAQVTAETGTVSPEALATAATMQEKYIKPVTAETRVTGAGEMVQAATAAEAPNVQAAQTTIPAAIIAAQGVVKPEELPQPAQIKEADMAQAKAITMSGLAPDAVAVAAKLEAFSVDNGTLALAAQGDVDARSTVQGQLSQLMQSFNDGATPAWASGAIRAANAAMAARGLGGSTMAGAAIFQAAMESALPIAAQDAQVFQQMNLANLNNRQQVALANAAAQQGLQLQNLSNEQQAALQNSANAFALQSQNLSNMQQTMIANAQIRASLQGQNLSNQQQANLATAARYAEMANINLNNIQQARLQDSANALQVDLANLSNRQQSYVVNAQLQAALQAQNLSNEQQAAVLNAARIAENNNMTFTASQQAQIHNSTLMQTIGLAELNAQQAATLANAATYAAMDMANLNNRQQAAVVNAQAFLAMDMKNLDNEQQTALFKSQQITNAILSDTAAENAAKQFNATSQNQTDQFFASLSTQVSQFNAAQKNALEQFNTDQANSVSKFNAEAQNARDQFNSNQSLVIAQSNAQWRREISTANTAATNAANYLNAQNLQAMTLAEYNNETQFYRDQIEMAWSSYEKDQDRANSIITTSITSSGSLKAAEANADSKMWESLTTAALAWWKNK